MNTQAVVDLTQSLGWIINQEKSELKPTQVFSFVGYKYHLDSALVKPTPERWLKLQDLILRLKSQHILTARCLISLIGFACLNGENGPGGTPSHETLSGPPQGALEISSVAGQPPPLDRSHFSTPRLVAKSLKRDERCRPSSQRPQYPTKDTSNEGWGAHLDQFYKGSVVRLGKKATHKCSRFEGGLPGPSKLQGPVPEPNSASCNGQLNSGSLHKQTRRNSLSRDVCSLMNWCHHSHITLKARHIPLAGCLNVMADLLSRLNQVQSTEWSLHLQVYKQICQKWFTPHVDLFSTHLNHKLPLYVSPVQTQRLGT